MKRGLRFIFGTFCGAYVIDVLFYVAELLPLAQDLSISETSASAFKGKC